MLTSDMFRALSCIVLVKVTASILSLNRHVSVLCVLNVMHGPRKNHLISPGRKSSPCPSQKS